MTRPTAAERVERILSILPYLLEQDGRTVTELAERFDMDPDELRADLQLCQDRVGVHPFTPDAYVNIVIDEDDDTVIAFFGDYFRRPLRLTPEEGLALLAAGRAVLESQGSVPDPVLAAAVEKLAAVVGATRSDAVEVSLGDGDTGVLRQVREAVDRHECLRLDYYSHGRDERTTRDVDPWSLESQGGHWYLTGRCHQAGGQRVFRVDRIASATPTGATFEPPTGAADAGVDLDLADAASSVELVVPPGAGWVADAYPTESVTLLDDGRTRVVLRVVALPWLERLLLRLGPEAEARELGSGASLAPLRAAAADRVLRGTGSLTPMVDPLTATPARGPSAKQRSSTRNAVEWVAVVVGAVVVALLVKTFLVQAFRIPSESMNPTLVEGDRVLVNKLSYRLHDIHRGDVVVFARPPELQGGADEPDDLIKRVIGVAGDTLVARDGVMYVNDHRLEEPYLPEGTSSVNLDQPYTVPEGEIFVMGDNRGNSQDSRVFGSVPTDTVVGRAFLVMWPPGRIATL